MVWIDAALTFVWCFRCLPDFHHLYTKLVLIKLSNLVFADAITSTVVYTRAVPLIFLVVFIVSAIFMPPVLSVIG